MSKYPVVILLVGLSLLMFVPQEGMAQDRDEEAITSDPLLYGLASFILPGLGQYLNGEPGKALAHLLIAVAIPLICDLITYYSFPFYYPRYRICTLVYVGWAAYSAIDAYQTAKRKGRGGTLSFTP